MSLASMNAQSVSISPPPGTLLPYGSTVRITPSVGALGSPVTEKFGLHVQVPDFSGHLLTDAVDWANQHEMFWAVPTLPAQNRIDTAHLFDAYRVSAQTPKPGQVITQGVTLSTGGFRLTPVSLTVVPSGER
jgi:hypothetical protein